MLKVISKEMLTQLMAMSERERREVAGKLARISREIISGEIFYAAGRETRPAVQSRQKRR